jgi:hypothetical protein
MILHHSAHASHTTHSAHTTSFSEILFASSSQSGISAFFITAFPAKGDPLYLLPFFGFYVKGKKR